MLMTYNQWELAATGYEEWGMLLNAWYKLLAWHKGITLCGDRAERQVVNSIWRVCMGLAHAGTFGLGMLVLCFTFHMMDM